MSAVYTLVATACGWPWYLMAWSAWCDTRLVRRERRALDAELETLA